MKNITILMILLTIFISSQVFSIERKNITDINTDAFTTETQLMLQGGGNDKFSLVWWIPNEFWDAVLSNDPSMSKSDKDSMLDAMKGTSLMAVVQADISRLGAFNFYTKEEIEKKMSIFISGNKNNKLSIQPLQTISADLEIVLGVFKPILGAAMGNLGKNMHFFVLSDKSEHLSRIIDPYEKGEIEIKLQHRDDLSVSGKIHLPLDSLFVPRKCSNGKDAHISWNYCPWSGNKLSK